MFQRKPKDPTDRLFQRRVKRFALPDLRLLGIALGVGLLALLVIAAIFVQMYAVYSCGWSQTLLYGKNIGWAWLTGYCG